MEETGIRDTLTALHPASFAWASVCCRGNRDLAEDVLQSVYLRVLDRQTQYDGRSSFRTWLFAVVRNTARSRLRQWWWSRVVRLDFESLGELRAAPEDSAEAKFEQGDEAAALRTALRRLPERQR